MSTRPPVVPDLDGYLDRWSGLHGGYDPRSSALVHAWLRLTYGVARPLAAVGVAPDVVSVATMALGSAAVVGLAGQAGRWLVAASLAVVLTGLADNVDGAVAVLRDAATRWGHVLDSLCDRVVDAAYLVALWECGAPAWLAVTGGGLSMLQEYARARAGAAGLDEIAVVTVSERPTRVIVTAAFLLGAGLFPAAAATWALAGGAVWAAAHVAGLGQLLVAVRRRLR